MARSSAVMASGEGACGRRQYGVAERNAGGSAGEGRGRERRRCGAARGFGKKAKEIRRACGFQKALAAAAVV